MAKLARMIRDKTSLQFKFAYALWTLAFVCGQFRDRIRLHPPASYSRGGE